MAVLKDLIVHGSSRFLNKSYFNTINAKSIGADQGIFKKIIATSLEAEEATIDNLTADNAIVTGLLDVQGELHTNAWTNANIANIGGSFYISPTVEPTDGTTTISITRNSATSWTISATGTFATDFIKSGTATSGVAWPANSLVLITGDVVVGNMVYPLGTLKGTLSTQVTATAATTSKTITINGVTDAQNNNAPSVLQELYSVNNNTNIASAPFKKGKISLYKLGSNPIGILMTSMGTSANSLIDIYGGVSTNPNVRIGHLAGLPNINGSAPTGWGIYTDNGYFSGVIVSNSGKIANFTINGNKLYSNGHDTYNKAVSGIYIGDDYISFGSGGVTYFNTSGTGKVGPWTLSTTYLRNGNIAGANNTSVAGVYLGTDGLNISGGTAASTAYIYKNGSNISVNIGNKLTWNGTTLAIDGAATIGGTTASTVVSNAANGAKTATNYITNIDSNNGITIKAINGTTDTNTTTGNYIKLNASGLELFKGGTSIALYGDTARIGKTNNSRFLLNASSLQAYNNSNKLYFEVSSTGIKYGTDLSSSSTTTTVASTTYADGKASAAQTAAINAAASDATTKANNAAKTATTYITDIDSNKGITVKPSDSSGNDYLQMNSSAIEFYRNNSSKLLIDDSKIQIKNGTTIYSQFNADSIKFYDGNYTTDVASANEPNYITAQFSSSGAVIGKTSSNHVLLSGTQLQLKNNGTVLADFGSTITLGQTTGDGLSIDTDGLKLYRNGKNIAEFGENIRLGVPLYSKNSTYTVVDNDGLKQYRFYANLACYESSNYFEYGEEGDDYDYIKTDVIIRTLPIHFEGYIDENKIKEVKLTADMGSVNSGSKTVNVTSNNVDTYVEGATITLKAGGVYIIHAYAAFPSNATEAIRRVQIYNKTASSALRTDSNYGRYYVTGDIMDIFKIGGTTNQTYCTRVSAGVAISNVATYIKAVRIV